MGLSRRMFAVAVLLTSGLMAANELPELFTLSDNISNDCGLASQGPSACFSQHVMRGASAAKQWLRAPNSHHRPPASFSSTTALEQTSPPLLSMLGVQRK